MSYPAIEVENLSKRYIINHQGNINRHDTLREFLTVSAKSLGQKLLHPGQGMMVLERQDFWALKDVSFDVKQGEVLGIIGCNGSGKSTLLKIFSRITEPTYGRVRLRGRVASLLEVGTGFHGDLTGRENVFLNGSIMGMSKGEIADKFDEIVEFAEVAQFIDMPVKRYSSGMSVRLAFSVAAHLECEILIVDEVLAVGDAAFQRKCLSKMNDIASYEKTVLLVSHNMAVLQSLCKQAIWLNLGKLMYAGEVSAVASKYLSATSGTLNLRKVWDEEVAPGNQDVKWKSILIIPENLEGAITVATNLKLAVECWNYKDSALLNFKLELLASDGILVLSTFSPSRQFPRGLIRGECLIPANLLNDRPYRIAAAIFQGPSRLVHRLENILEFSVLDTVHSTSRKSSLYTQAWPGLVRPDLQWKVHEADLV